MKLSLHEDDLFVIYSLPYSNDHNILVHDEEYVNDHNYFEIAPFRTKEEIVPTKRIFSKSYDKNLPFDFVLTKLLESFHGIDDQKLYEQKILQIKGDIKKESLKKLVLSRRIEEKVDNHDIYNSFLRLKSLYPSSFRYLFNIPSYGTWMGATPELLIKKTELEQKTVAMAGTLPVENYSWTEKEIDEQAIICDYFESQFSQKNFPFKKSKTETVEAGLMVHRRTNYFLPKDLNTYDIINTIHPSPAICGVPYPYALEYVNNIEQHPRKYYCGYLGLHSSTNVDYYVNIRCMELFKNASRIYVGGGITRDSIPENEWYETELKADILRAVCKVKQEK